MTIDGPRAGLVASVQVTRGAFRLEAALSAGPDQVVAVLGPNGAGKSTLLRALAGLERLQAGSVVLEGRVLEDAAGGVRLAPEQRPVGVVFQEYLLFPHLSALDNVAFGLRARGATRSEARRAGQAWLDRMGIGDRAGRRPSELSGGESQRVALARALVTRPRLLLLDEPLSALDASTAVQVRRELLSHFASFNGVRLLVTHDPLEAMALGDVMVVVEAGRVVQSGSLADLTARPRSRYVADLVGMNLYSGLAGGDRVELAGGGVLSAADAGVGPVLAVVHPRAVALHRRRPEGTPRNVWFGRVERLDHQGERVRVRLGGSIPIVAEVTPAAVAELGLSEHGEVWASVKASEVGTYPA